MPTKLPEQEQKPYAVSKNILYGKKYVYAAIWDQLKWPDKLILLHASLEYLVLIGQSWHSVV